MQPRLVSPARLLGENSLEGESMAKAWAIFVGGAAAGAVLAVLGAAAGFPGLQMMERPPDTVIAAALGAFIAAVVSVFGVLAANKSSAQRLKMQLDHDRDQAALKLNHEAAQKRADRAIAAKRQVYLEGVEKCQALIAHIAGLPDCPAGTRPNLQPFLDVTTVLAKVWLIANAEAALHVRSLPELFTKALLHCEISAAPYREAVGRDGPGRHIEWRVRDSLKVLETLRPCHEGLTQLVCLLRHELELATDVAAFTKVEQVQQDRAAKMLLGLLQRSQRDGSHGNADQ